MIIISPFTSVRNAQRHLVNEARSIPCEIFHIKKSVLRLRVLNINTITTGPFLLVHPLWYIQKAAAEALISTSWKMGELYNVHCFTCKPQSKPNHPDLPFKGLSSLKRSQELFVNDIKTSVYPALSESATIQQKLFNIHYIFWGYIM